MASEYLKWKYRDVQPDAPVERTKKQRRQNWWHYHKWHVGIGVLAAAIAGNLAWHVLTQVHPDYQIAYVGTYPLSKEEAAAWEDRLSALGTDCSGDGRVVVQLNQYPTGGNGGDPMYAAASNVKLMADLDSCESYFFCWRTRRGSRLTTRSCKGTGFLWKTACFWRGGSFGRTGRSNIWTSAARCGRSCPRR